MTEDQDRPFKTAIAGTLPTLTEIARMRPANSFQYAVFLPIVGTRPFQHNKANPTRRLPFILCGLLGSDLSAIHLVKNRVPPTTTNLLGLCSVTEW